MPFLDSKSPPWHMNPAMILWMIEPLYQSGTPAALTPAEPVHRARKLGEKEGQLPVLSSALHRTRRGAGHALLCGLGDCIGEELEDDPAEGGVQQRRGAGLEKGSPAHSLAFNAKVEEDARVHHSTRR